MLQVHLWCNLNVINYNAVKSVSSMCLWWNKLYLAPADNTLYLVFNLAWQLSKYDSKAWKAIKSTNAVLIVNKIIASVSKLRSFVLQLWGFGETNKQLKNYYSFESLFVCSLLNLINKTKDSLQENTWMKFEGLIFFAATT